ncbi:MAG: formate dehydrogenase accessory sulfurtransferase FdhD, partial [Bacteroidota bacterium]
METAGIALHSIIKANKNTLRQQQQDILAVEEPLQIQLQLHTNTGRITKNIAVTMRTPGNDNELAAGFLFTEGILTNREQIASISHVHN